MSVGEVKGSVTGYRSYPLVIDCERELGGPRNGGLDGKGRVSSRSAREYWCVRKKVCASQKASLGSSE